MPMSKRYVRIVRSFHTLANAPGVSDSEIDLDLLDRWASGDPNAYTATRGPFPGDGCKNAARFALNLWDSVRVWRSGSFNIFHAIMTWDDSQRAAWQAWAAEPWRP
jgi:hypothetical protein